MESGIWWQKQSSKNISSKIWWLKELQERVLLCHIAFFICFYWPPLEWTCIKKVKCELGVDFTPILIGFSSAITITVKQEACQADRDTNSLIRFSNYVIWLDCVIKSHKVKCALHLVVSTTLFFVTFNLHWSPWVRIWK